MVEELFAKKLPITLKAAEREDRKAHIVVTVEIHTSTAPVHKKELVIRLTDESDLFFLYTVTLNEEDFQSLKVQQGLLVDFGAFPQKFIDLLGFVLSEEHKENPKFIVDFTCSGGSIGTSTGYFNIIETNPFKHLTHLSLKFLPGTDSDVKKYLAGCLKALKDQNAHLLHKMEHTETDLSQSLRQAREALASRTVELDTIKKEWSEKLTSLTAKHNQELHTIKEKSLQDQTSQQHKHEKDKQDVVHSQSKTVKQLEIKVYDLENANKELTDRRYKSEATIRELKSKLNSLEEEHHRAKQELSSTRKSNTDLEADLHEQEKLGNQLRMRLAVLEQEVKDKEYVLKKSNDLQHKDQEQMKRHEDDLDKSKRKITKLEMSVKTLSQELMKGNEIIKKLQGEIKTYHTKLKLRNQVTTEQEKLLGEKSKDMDTLKNDLETTSKKLKDKEEENRKLNDNLEASMQKLDESRQLLKTNENVISWLNKQVTDAQMNQHKFIGGPFEMNSSASSAGLHRPLQQSQGSYSHGRPTMSGSLHTTPGSMVSHVSGAGLHGTYPPPRSTPSQPTVNYNPGQPLASRVPVPLAKSSPLSMASIAENVPSSSPHLTPPSNMPIHSSKEERGGSLLDAKYFHKSDDNAAITTRDPSPIPIHFKQVPVAASSSNPNRLSRDVIAPRLSGPPEPTKPMKQQSHLASAYFPGASKVS